MTLAKQTIIRWRETLLGIEVGAQIEMSVPRFGVPSSLSSTASQLKNKGLASFKIERFEKKLIIKRIA